MLHQLVQTHKHKRIRRGRGNARRGTYSGRGVKGQKARTGHRKLRPGFEGGRTPLSRLLPKRRGLRQNPVTFAVPVNLGDLSVFPKNAKVTLRTLKEKGIVPKSTKNVKILGEGDIMHALHFALPPQNFSASAKSKIEKAGGVVPVEMEKVVAKEMAEPTKDAKQTKPRTKKTS